MNYIHTEFPNKAKFLLTDFSKGDVIKSLNKDDYKIIWARTSSVKIIIDGYHINLEKNQLLFCTPLNEIAIEVPFNGLVAYIFNREFYCIREHDKEIACNGMLFLGSSVPPLIELDNFEQKKYNILLNMFEEEFQNDDRVQGEMLRVLLKRLIIKSVRLLNKGMPSHDYLDTKLETIRQFNLLVEEHFKNYHKVADYAGMLNLAPKSVSNIFSNFNYKSPIKVINERINLEAQRLLQFSDKNMNEIAQELGFTEASHFSKFFKKQTGLSPLAFKHSFIRS